MASFVIFVHRGPDFVTGGPKKFVLARGGEILKFESQDAALKHCRQLNQAFRTRQAWYTVEEWN